MMLLQLLWVRWMVIETKGVPLEQVQQRLGLHARIAVVRRLSLESQRTTQ